jgi:hypothetical protein
MALFAMMALCPLPASSETAADCNAIHTGPCTKLVQERKVTLEIDPKPVRHMAELTFRVTVEPCMELPSILLLDLGMPGMMMGENRVRMSRKSACTWEGKGIIVRCMSGRKLWQATILSPALANPSFTFDVRD